MANPWFRVWGDMVNDPKWRTIARKSGQKIGDVIAVYMHMLTCASNATERGRTQGWCDEDVATALDIEIDQVGAIREAMQGRVLDGDYLTGWEKRQPIREDEGSAARSRAWREAKKAEKTEKERNQTNANATERKETLDKDTDKNREDKKEQKQKPAPDGELLTSVDPQIAADFKAMRKKQRAEITKTAIDGIEREAAKAGLSLEEALRMCCERGWRGFKAEWVGQQARASPGGSQLGKAGQATALNAQRLMEKWRKENGQAD